MQNNWSSPFTRHVWIGGGTPPLFFYLGARWSWMVNIVFQQLYPRRRNHSTERRVGLMSPGTGQDPLQKRKWSCCCQESNRDFLVVHPVAWSPYRPRYAGSLSERSSKYRQFSRKYNQFHASFSQVMCCLNVFRLLISMHISCIICVRYTPRTALLFAFVALIIFGEECKSLVSLLSYIVLYFSKVHLFSWVHCSPTQSLCLLWCGKSNFIVTQASGKTAVCVI